MARSGFSVSEALLNAWKEAVEDLSTRALLISVNTAESRVDFGRGVRAEGSLEDDFSILADFVQENPGTDGVWLLHTTESKWVLVTYIPDSLPASRKMVLSSSTPEILDALDRSKIQGHFHASSPDELTWNEFYEWFSRHGANGAAAAPEAGSAEDIRRQIFGAWQKLVSADAATTQAGDSDGKSGTGSGASVAFPLEDDARDQLRNLAIADSGVHCVELSVSGKETLTLRRVGYTASVEELVSHFPDSDARFLVISASMMSTSAEGREGSDSCEVSVVFACPEALPLRAKMHASSAAARVREVVASEAGLRVQDYMEAHDAEELQERLQGRSDAQSGEEPSSSPIGVGDMQAGKPTFRKPKAPGRRRRRDPTL